jgi:SAM-dependent methyltransferase
MRPSAFDEAASEYQAALADPWRERFANDADFFVHQKCRAMLRHIDRDGGRMPDRPAALDVGCGKGPAVAFLDDRWRIVGTDVSGEMLKHGPARLKLAVQEQFALPFADGTFDVVFAFCVYHHIAREQHVRHLHEMVRVTRQGGWLFVFEHNPFNPVTQLVFRRAPVDRGCAMIAPGRLRRTFQMAGAVAVTTGYVLFFPQGAAERAPALEAALRRLPLGGQYYVAGRKPA